MKPNSKLIPIVLVYLVSKYLESHKRLIVPQLGAFIVKEPGCVLFSELLKRDDGVLRGLLKEAGMSEVEAAGEIDRFVFEIRHAVERGVGSPLRGIGLMRPGPNGTIAFDFNPLQEAPGPVSGRRKSADQLRDRNLSAEDSSVNAAGPSGGASVPAGNQPLPPYIASSKGPHAEKSAFSELNLSRSVKLNPEPYVKGLRYGKPHKNTNAYTYVGHGTRRWSMDRFLLVAIAAAVVAVAAIAFGYLRKSREDKSAIPATEQVQTDPAQAAQPTPEK